MECLLTDNLSESKLLRAKGHTSSFHHTSPCTTAAQRRRCHRQGTNLYHSSSPQHRQAIAHNSYMYTLSVFLSILPPLAVAAHRGTVHRARFTVYWTGFMHPIWRLRRLSISRHSTDVVCFVSHPFLCCHRPKRLWSLPKTTRLTSVHISLHHSRIHCTYSCRVTISSFSCSSPLLCCRSARLSRDTGRQKWIALSDYAHVCNR